jgi:hypothetical protein
MPISSTELPNSTFLDYESDRSGSAPLTGGSAAYNFTINVALGSTGPTIQRPC